MTKKRIITAILLVCMVFSACFLVSCGGDGNLEYLAHFKKIAGKEEV